MCVCKCVYRSFFLFGAGGEGRKLANSKQAGKQQFWRGVIRLTLANNERKRIADNWGTVRKTKHTYRSLAGNFLQRYLKIFAKSKTSSILSRLGFRFMIPFAFIRCQ